MRSARLGGPLLAAAPAPPCRTGNAALASVRLRASAPAPWQDTQQTRVHTGFEPLATAPCPQETSTWPDDENCYLQCALFFAPPPPATLPAPNRQTAAKVLTETQIRGAKPELKSFKLVDPGGLVLLVQPTGTKLWRYRFNLHGAEGMFALGRYPDISLKRARELHQEARKLVAEGINPVHQRRQASIKTTLASFGVISQAWQDATRKKLRGATIDQRRRELDKHLLPRFKTRDANGITRPELAQFLTSLSKKTPETARNLRTHLNAIFEHGIDLGLVDTNPTPPARVLEARRSKNHPALAVERLGNFLRALDQSRTGQETRIAMLLVILTASRKNEVVEATWSEFDLPGKAWNIPAVRMKAKRDHWVPLSDQAVALLRDLKKVSVERAHLFPNRVDPSRPMANRTLNALLDRLGYGSESTPHGMRAVFSTHFNKQGANIDVIEHCLAHAPVDRVRAAYNRHDYQSERREMLQSWANFVDGARVTSS